MHTIPYNRIAQGARDRIVGFCQRAIQAESLPGHEGALAALVRDEMRTLGYDAVQVDEAGNVIGKLNGADGRTALLHAHLDIVDPGDATRWRFPPYSGTVTEGHVWGRGTSDTKGSLVAMVYALGLLREAGLAPPGDVYMSAVVGEEIGGLGTRHLIAHPESMGGRLPDLAVIGEPSANTLRRGHRGRFEFVVTMHGRSAHASAPERGRNPHYAMSRFLLALRDTPMMADDTFGGSSVVPTLLYVDQTSSNVIPAEVSVHLDWRKAPSETLEQARAVIDDLVSRAIEPDISASVRLRSRRHHTYTGLEIEAEHRLESFCLDADDPDLLLAHRALEEALWRPVETSVWTFCTDGGHLYAAGVPCIGYGPGNEAMAHVLDERISIEQLVEATTAYMALAMALGVRHTTNPV